MKLNSTLHPISPFIYWYRYVQRNPVCLEVHADSFLFSKASVLSTVYQISRLLVGGTLHRYRFDELPVEVYLLRRMKRLFCENYQLSLWMKLKENKQKNMHLFLYIFCSDIARPNGNLTVYWMTPKELSPCPGAIIYIDWLFYSWLEKKINFVFFSKPRM